MILLWLVILGYNLYFIFLLDGMDRRYLYYLDFLSLLFLGLFFAWEWFTFHRRKKEQRELLQQQVMIFESAGKLEDEEIFLHDLELLNEQLNEQFEINCELQDYIAKWCHEVKIPLAAALLIDERIEDLEIRRQMRVQLERIRQHLNCALTGCKVRSSIYDLQIQKVSLKECVSTSIQNNQFFLINHHFELFMQVGDEEVYTDKEWIVYVLDQLIANAIKYADQKKEIHIWSKKEHDQIILGVEDRGEGIRLSLIHI